MESILDLHNFWKASLMLQESSFWGLVMFNPKPCSIMRFRDKLYAAYIMMKMNAGMIDLPELSLGL